MLGMLAFLEHLRDDKDMGLSHILLPPVYKAFYKLYRGDLLPEDRVTQIIAQQQTLEYLVNVLPLVIYGTENNVVYCENPLNTLQNLPVRSYEELYPWIDRTWNGEESVLWPGRTLWFAKSSGTTNARSKYIPMTEECIEQNHFLASRDLGANYLERNPSSKVGFNSTLTISGSIQDVNKISGAQAGDVSAVLDAHSPWWFQLSKVLPKSILEIPTWEGRLPYTIDFLKDSDVKAFAGVTSWVHKIIEESIKKYGVEHALKAWPNLEVFFHGGVAITPYMESLQKLIPKKDFNYVGVYNASEGFFAFQDTNDEENGALLLCGHGIFYEFRSIKTNIICTIGDVALNSDYELILSTVSGLWRYALGDVVRIVSLDPVRIKVVGRTKAVLNVYGEELMVGNVDEAIVRLNKKHSYGICEYTGCPIYKNEINSTGGHEWILEMDTTPENKIECIADFDSILRELNSDYHAKRTGDAILTPPKIHFVQKGTFYNWMKSRGKLGGQNKIPRLSESREHLESILKMIY